MAPPTGPTPPPLPTSPTKVVDEKAVDKLEEVNVKLDDQIRLQEESNKRAKEKVELLTKILALEDEITLTASTNINQAKAEIDALQKRIDLRNADIAANKESQVTELEYLQAKNEIRKKEEEIARNNLIVLTKQYEEAKKLYGESDARTMEAEAYLFNQQKDLAKILALNNEIGRNEEEQLRIAREQYAVKQQIDYLDRDIGILLRDQLGTTLGLNNLVKALALGMNPAVDIFKEMIVEGIKLIDVVAKSNAEFTKMTGQLADRSINFGYGMASYGIGFAQLDESMRSLTLTMSNFTNIADKDTKEALAANAARLKTLGVETTTTAKNFDILSKSFNYSEEQLGSLTNEMARHAIGSGISVKQMSEDFAGSMERLAAHGAKGIDVFYALEKQAKSLGVSMQTLTGLVGEQWDTFDGSAKAAGRLNALMGGNYINAVDMMRKSEEERLLTLKQQLHLKGVDINTMDAATKRAYANALGIKNIADMNKILNKSVTDLTNDTYKQAATQEQLRKAEEASVEMKQKFAIIFQQLLILVRPFVYILEQLTRVIAVVADSFGGWGGKILTFITAVKAVKFALKTFRIEVELTKAAVTFGLSLALSYAIEQFLDLNDAARDASDSMQLAHHAVVKPSSPPFYIAVKMLGDNMNYLGETTNKQKGNLDAFTNTAKSMNKQLQPTVESANQLGQAFNNLNSIDVSKNLSNAADSLSTLKSQGGIAKEEIASLNNMSIGLKNGINTNIGTSLNDIAGSIQNLSAGNNIIAMQSLADILRFFNEFDVSENSSYKKLALAIKEIGEALKELPDNKMISFVSNLDSLSTVLPKVTSENTDKLNNVQKFISSPVEPTNIANATKFASASREYYSAQKDSKGISTEAMTAAFKQAIIETTSTNQTPTSVAINLDGRQVASAVIPHMDRKFSSANRGIL